MSAASRVTICVPVYNARPFLAATLGAIQRQRYEHFSVLMSDDGSDDGSADIAAVFTSDPRFRLVRQPRRLGWVDNCNWLLQQATDDLLCIVSHDDLPTPDFLLCLVEQLDAVPGCAMVFSDIQIFGLLDHVEHQPSLCGEPDERVRAFLASHYDGTAFHGLVRRWAVEASGGLRGNAMEQFAADVSWLARIARAGDCLRLPQALYHKRRHAPSASMQWGRWSQDTMAEAWVCHCRELLQDVLDAGAAPAARALLVRAVLRRVLALEPLRPFMFIRDLPRARQAAMIEALLAGMPGIGDDDLAAAAAVLSETPGDA